MSSLIQWPRAKYWDKAYNPVIGCKPISEGCENCWAKAQIERFKINGGSFEPKLMPNAKPPQSGVVFVGNMTDIFGEWNWRETIWECLAPLSSSAINLILTKRAERIAGAFHNGSSGCWFGVTCENQARADERIPHLLKAEVKHRWLSLEPLLGSIMLDEYIYRANKGKLHWVVVGAESGQKRRECKIEWIENVVEKCQRAGVPVFVKQIHLNGKLITDINKFPEHLRIRQVPWSRI